MAQTIYPQQFNLVTSADETGMLSDIERITGESLSEYKKRILESSKKIANSSYEGLINGINRELGLVQQEVIQTSLKEIYNGDLADPDFLFTDYTISDNRYYTGIIDGVNTHIVGNKLTSHIHLWPDNHLVGLTVVIAGKHFKIISNNYNQITINEDFPLLFINETFILRTELVPNSLIGFGVLLNNDKYEIISNTNNSITLNKTIIFKNDKKFKVILNRPRVKITTSRIILYKEYLNEENYQLDLVIDLHENNITHKELCEQVNANSQYFYCTNLIPYSPEVKGFTLIQNDSDIKVFEEIVPSTKFFKLKHKNVKAGTLKFSESNIFGKEEEELNSELFGPYYSSNYKEGIITTNMLPDGTGLVSYTYMDFPFSIYHAPAIIIGLSNKESEQFLFSQKEKILYNDFRSRFVSSQPKADMIEYIAELIKTSKQAWGE